MVCLIFSLGRKAPATKSPAAVNDVPGHLPCSERREERSGLSVTHTNAVQTHTNRKARHTLDPNVGTDRCI
jgi:hypothetical protein